MNSKLRVLTKERKILRFSEKRKVKNLFVQKNYLHLPSKCYPFLISVCYEDRSYFISA